MIYYLGSGGSSPNTCYHPTQRQICSPFISMFGKKNSRAPNMCNCNLTSQSTSNVCYKKERSHFLFLQIVLGMRVFSACFGCLLGLPLNLLHLSNAWAAAKWPTYGQRVKPSIFKPPMKIFSCTRCLSWIMMLCIFWLLGLSKILHHVGFAPSSKINIECPTCKLDCRDVSIMCFL